ncbi:MAG: hypothetical protein IJ224_05515 [Lachnospiraceae bacterium]|nr:hypothetical protein [Lachnospiraceae bacterium]
MKKIIFPIIFLTFVMTACSKPSDDLDLKQIKTTEVSVDFSIANESNKNDNTAENTEISEQNSEYSCAEDFESALNNGIDGTGAIVTFTVVNVAPDSLFGYDLWAGEHLNFIIKDNIGAEVGDTMTVEVEKVETALGSWIIYCK